MSTRRAVTPHQNFFDRNLARGVFERHDGHTAAEGATVPDQFTFEDDWPELFAPLDAAQRDSVRQALAAGWHAGFVPTREEVENITDYARGVIDMDKYQRRGDALARRIAGADESGDGE